VLTRRADALERERHALVSAHRPRLLAETGCGALTAALLIGRSAGAQRFPSDASFARQTGTAAIPCASGQRHRHRLDRGSDRQPNHALHIIAITRARHDPATRAYLARKEAEGKGKKGALGCLKRHLARRVQHLLSLPAKIPQNDPRTRPAVHPAAAPAGRHHDRQRRAHSHAPHQIRSPLRAKNPSHRSELWTMSSRAVGPSCPSVLHRHSMGAPDPSRAASHSGLRFRNRLWLACK
jgi:hypothetical protein